MLHAALKDPRINVGEDVVLMVTKGERRIGRTIRKLSNSVEFSTKESMARRSEVKHNKQAQEAQARAF